MDKNVFREIAHEVMGLHNGALRHIKRHEYAEAMTQYSKALIITEKVHYYEGMAMTLFSMANLSIIAGNLFEALNNAADARDLFIKSTKAQGHCDELIRKITNGLKKQGIAYEKKGMFKEAVTHFEACLPFIQDKAKQTIEHEVNLLRKIIDEVK